MARAPLIEVFASVQGEGRFVGHPMAFARVATCPIRCTYCDTEESYRASPEFEARVGGEVRRLPNPVEAEAAAKLLAEVAAGNPFGRTSFVSLTGGEPLVYPEFIAAFGTALHGHGLALFLESAAVDGEALGACIGSVDHASLDYKLPGTLAEGPVDALPAEHLACVETAVGRGITVDVKFVLTRAVQVTDFAAACERLQAFTDGIGIVLQPVTPHGSEAYPCPSDLVARCARHAADRGFDVRVIPQTHKMLGVP